jgi:hypothetical protein
MALTRNGKLFILTRLKQLRPRDLTRTSDSISTDHSTSSLDYQ